MFKKILVLHDLSEASKRALDWAINIGRFFGSDLKVLNLRDDAEKLEKNFDVKVHNITIRLQKQIKKFVTLLTMEKKNGFPLGAVDIQVACGKKIPSILKIIEDENADLVVLGTHSRTGVKRILLGSVAENVVRHSSSLVLVAKTIPDWPPKKIKNILIPIDFSEFTGEALALGVRFCEMVGAGLELLHVVEVTENQAKLKQDALAQLKTLAAQYPAVKVRVHVSAGSAVEEISRKAEEIECEFVLIPTHGRSGLSRFFMGSVAEMVVRYIPVNIFSFCPEEQMQKRRQFLETPIRTSDKSSPSQKQPKKE